MPRFSLKAVLVLFGVVAIWLSTLANYPGAMDVQAFIVLSVLICSAVAAWSYTGRRRAFWIGFAATLICLHTMYDKIGPMFDWADRLASELSRQDMGSPSGMAQPFSALHSIINRTICFSVYIVAAAINGLLCLHIYDAGKRPEKS